jgi:hypothetical protein
VGGTTYSIASQTNVTMTNLGLTVLVITRNPVTTSTSHYLFSLPGALYAQTTFAVTQAAFGTVTVNSRTAFESLVVFNNTYDTARCIQMRSPYSTSITFVSQCVWCRCWQPSPVLVSCSVCCSALGLRATHVCSSGLLTWIQI